MANVLSDVQHHDIADEGLESSDEEAKTSHELRVSGKSRQIVEELEYLIQGIHSGSVNVKRSSLIEFAVKLSKQKFKTDIRAHSPLSKIFVAISNDPDNVIFSHEDFKLDFKRYCLLYELRD
jgi:hypothetical protein